MSSSKDFSPTYSSPIDYFSFEASSVYIHYISDIICCDEIIFVTSQFDTNLFFSDFIPSCDVSSLETETNANAELLLSISIS